MRKLIVVLAAAAVLSAAAPAVAQAPHMTLTIGKPGAGPQGTITTVVYGELVRLSGNISRGGENQAVELIIAPYRGTPRRVTLRTDSQGFFRTVHRPTIRTTYAARMGTLESRQGPLAHVRPKVGLRASRVRGRLVFRWTMQAQPEHVSRIAWFQRRVSRTRWVNVKKLHTTRRNLSVRFRARLPRGFQRVRVLVPQTPGYLRTTSDFVRVLGLGR